MTLPAIPASADKRRHWWLAAAILLVVVFVFGATGRAQEADPYSATVKVDATAASVVEAREQARVDGQRRALAKVLQRLSGSDSTATLPRLSDAAITDLVASFEVADERMSAVRYVADYTFHFRPAAIRKVLQQAGLPANGTTGTGAAGPVTIIPVYQAGGETRLWADPNPWREAWERLPAMASSESKFVLPLGDIADIAAIDAPRAVSGDAGALTAIARRDHTDLVVVALAAAQGPPDNPTGVDVTVRRYRAGQLLDTHKMALTASPGESGEALLHRAAAAIAANLAGAWSAAPAPPVAAKATLTAVLPIAGLEDWLQTRQRLAGMPAIRAISLKALSQQAATIDIGYTGSIAELKTELASIHLDLVGGAPLWHLARSGAGATP